MWYKLLSGGPTQGSNQLCEIRFPMVEIASSETILLGFRITSAED